MATTQRKANAMKWFPAGMAMVTVLVLAGCGSPDDLILQADPINPHKVLSDSEVVGDWRDAQGHRVITLYTPCTDRSDLREFIKRFTKSKGSVTRLEFYNDRARTPDLNGLDTLDEVLAHCNAADRAPFHVATHDGQTDTTVFADSIQ